MYRTYFCTCDAVHFHVAVNLALSHDCLKGCPASSTGRVSATLNFARCKPLSTRVRLHPGGICLEMFVNGLAVTAGQGGFTGCQFLRLAHALASLITAASRNKISCYYLAYRSWCKRQPY